MRVVDDISGLDAVVLELDAGRAEDADGAEADGRDDAARDDERSRERLLATRERPAAPQPPSAPEVSRRPRDRPARSPTPQLATRSP